MDQFRSTAKECWKLARINEDRVFDQLPKGEVLIITITITTNKVILEMGNNILTTTTTIIITPIVIPPGAKKTVARPAPIVHEQGEADQGDEDVVKDDHWL